MVDRLMSKELEEAEVALDLARLLEGRIRTAIATAHALGGRTGLPLEVKRDVETVLHALQAAGILAGHALEDLLVLAGDELPDDDQAS